MKRIILLLILVISSISALKAQCPTEDVELTTQAELDAFVTSYAVTCTDIPVSLTITGTITDVSGLNFMTSIQGNLTFSFANDLVEIIGFTNLTSVGGDLIFGRNEQLVEISGFNNLVNVNGQVSFFNIFINFDVTPNYQNRLDLISGFNSLITVGGDFRINQSRRITFDGFSNLETIGGNFGMAAVSFDSFTGLTALERIDGNISFTCTSWNEATVSTINVFTSLTSIGGNFNVSGTTNSDNSCYTSDIGLDFLNNLTTIEGSINVYKFGIRSGLTGLETLGGDLLLESTNNFVSLESLISIGGTIEYKALDDSTLGTSIDTNATMEFPNLESIGGNINMPNTFPGMVTIEEINLNSLTYIGGNINLSGLDGLTLGNVSINSLTHMDGSINLSYLLNSTTASFSMNSLQTIGSSISLNLIFASNISFESLYAINQNFQMYGVDWDQINLNGLIPVLHTVGGNININNNDGLSSLDDLESVQNIGGTLNIQNNDNLVDCSAICEYVSNHTNYTIDNNTLECITSQTCTSNTIQGTILHDIDLNGCTAADAPLENIEVIANDGINSFISYTDATGAYSITVAEGTYNVYANSSNEIDITPGPQDITFTGSDNIEIIDFCATFNTLVEDVSIVISPVYIAVPGFEARYSIVIENHGTIIQNGTINFTFSDADLDFTSATITPTTQAANILTWDYTNLIAGETRSIIAYFDVLPPPVNNIGDVLTFSGSAPLATDANPNDNQDNIFQVVLSSFDPNDKTVVEGEHLLMEDIDKYLHYVIRFQNEGTSPAVNIRIVDFMSDLIDWETFEPVDASHDYSVALVTGEDQKLEFFFNDIYLPDSTTDEPNSHGYITFRVKPKSTVQVGDLLNNRAAIYFDFNAPIITNKTETRIVEDTDGDTIYNYQDNCPDTANTDQADQDGDGIGDACDDDIDDDGILNADDNCPLVASDDLNDNDNDGLGDVCDDDDDNDGVLDVDDTCPFTANADQNDTDNDGLGDICDDDDDDDGILDADDNCPLVANANQGDFDEDGLGDLCDDDDDNDGILDIDDDCPYYSGTNTSNGCPFYLPADNLIIETTSETCVNQNNAEINIKAIADYTYEVNLLLNGTVVVIPVNTFTSELTIENLSAGTYELCISIPAENYEQCFTLEIEDPATLNANSVLSRSNEYSLDLIGATNYSIFINGEEHTVIAPDESTTVTFTKQLSKPVNTIEVNTEKACQGKFKETVKTIENLDFTIVPNPTNGDIFITSILGDKTSSGTLNIYDVSGRVVSTQVVQFPMQNKQIQINSLTAGVYFITLNTENYSNTKKLIKR